ncbi:nucleoside phosphorylase domain-containing protein [Mariannaea sp. PMI_226]|nr:nucleoside phosphorylase domain-containing protein [Mariannaea sp. PMI_226]
MAEPPQSRQSDLRPILHYEEYTIAWICARQEETEAAIYMLDARHRGVFPHVHGDDNHYIPGEIAGHMVVITCLPRNSTGTVSASTVVSQIRQSFRNLRYGLMVGVGAGVPGPNLKPDIRLGDVVVATPSDNSSSPAGVIGYDLGAETVDGFILRDWQAPTDRRLRNALEWIKIEAEFEGTDDFVQYLNVFASREQGRNFMHPMIEDNLYQGDESNELVARPPRETGGPKVHYGPIASGNKLIKNAKLRDELRDKYGIFCFEMESAGIMNTIPVAVIRGVCHYADSHQNDIWNRYAAATAAAYAKGLLNQIGPETKVAIQSAPNSK